MQGMGAQFCVCMFLDSRDTSLNILKFGGTINETKRRKQEQKERHCCGFRSKLTNYTVWPRNFLIKTFNTD